MPTGSQTLRFLLAVAAFAVCVRKILQPLASELAASAVFFVHAWLIAYAHITVFRTAVDSVRTQFALPTGSQTLRFLLAVAAFAVYIQINRSALSSELDAPHCCFVCAWLIANAHIPGTA